MMCSIEVVEVGGGKKGKGRKKRPTYHLEGGEVFLPPDELLVLGSHGSNHVIEVHDNMHECVEQAEEGGMSAGGEANAEPYAHRHDTMVDDMQQRDMLLFLAQHEEELHTGCIQLKKQKTKNKKKKERKGFIIIAIVHTPFIMIQ